MSIQTRHTTAKRSLILGVTIALGAVSGHANLLVDDSMNRYSLFGKRGVHLDQYAKTARGGLLGSDVVVRVSGDDTMMAPVVVAGNLTMMNNVGNNWFRDIVRVGKDVNGNTTWHDHVFDSAVYVGGNMGVMQHNNKFKDQVYLGGTLSKEIWANTNSFAGTVFTNATQGSFSAPFPITGLNWGVAPQTVIPSSMPWPDTAFAPMAGRSVKSGPLCPLSGGIRRWTCGTNAASGGADLVAAGVCQANDTILPPGNYDVLDIWFGSTIYLGEGTYSFNSVNLQNALGNGVTTRLLAVQPHGLRTVILTKNGLIVNPSGSFNIIAPEKYQLGYGVDSTHFAGGTMMIYSESSLALNVSTEIWATVVVPKPGTMVEISDRVHLFGQILADSIHVKNYFKGTDGAFIPYFPNLPSVKVANFGWTGPEGSLGQNTAAGLNLQMDHVNGLGVKVWYHTLTPSRDTIVGGVSYKPAFAGDFDSSAGVVVIPATMTTGAIPVNIHGNNLHQPNRYFIVILDSIQNGSLDSTVLWNGKVAGGAYILDDDPTPTFRVDSVWTTEGTGPGTKTFKFVLSMIDSVTGAVIDPSRSGGASFTWSTIPGTADTTDFIPVHSRSITWPAGQMRDTLRVQVWQDSSYEATETFLVRIDTFSNVQTISPKAVRMALGKIINDDSVARIFVNDAIAREGDTLSFQVSLSSVSAIDACFNWQTSNGTAVAGKDYVASSGSGICIHPGSTSMLLKVPTLSDQVYEDTETVLLSLRPVSGITRTGSDTNALGKIVNTNSAPGIAVNDTFVVRSTTASRTLTFTVRLTDSSGQGMVSAAPSVFSYTLVPITATPGTDYVVSSGQLTIPILTNSIAIPVVIPADPRWYANPLQFKVVLTAVSGIDTTVRRTRTTGIGSIFTGVGKPVLHVYDTSANEGNTGSNNPIVFRVALLDSTGTAVTSRDPFYFTWSTSNGTAVAGTDYTAVSASAVTLPAGQKYAYVGTTLIGNDTYQSNRAFNVQLTYSSSGKPNERLSATGTIVDDDLPPKVSIDDQSGYRPSSQTSNDSDWVFHIWLGSPSNPATHWASGKPVSVRVRSLDSSAQVGLQDYYQLLPQTIVFAAGQTDTVVRVKVRKDLHFAPTLAFKVVLDSLSGATFQDSLGVGTILNSNPKPILQVIGPGLQNEGDTAQVVVQLVDPRSNSATWSRVATPYTWIANDSAGGARHDSDYVPLSTSPDAIPAGASYDTLRFRLIVHQMQLPTRYFRVTGTPDTSVAALVDSVRHGFVGIVNHAPPPKIWVSSTTNPEPRPGDTTYYAQFRLSLTAPSGLSYKVVVRTSDGSAVQDVNYRGRQDTLVFAPKETWKDFRVLLLNDGIWDTSKSYIVTVIDRGGLDDSAGSQGRGTIVNSDTLRVGVTPAFQTVGKDTAETNEAVFHVTLSLPANQQVVLKYATRDSSVQAAGIYQPIAGTIVFRPGQVDTVLRVTVPPSNLKLTQANYFVLELDSARVRLASRDSTIGYSNRMAVARIFDATNASRFTIDDVSTAKRDTVVWFHFHLNRPVASSQTIQFRTVSGSAIAGRDFRDTSGSYVINATDTSGAIPVHILADSAYFANPRKFTLSISYDDTFIVLRKPDGIGTITDLTSPPAVYLQDAPAVRETQTAWFPVRTTKPNSDTMRVVWSTVNGSAVAGTNFQGHVKDTLLILPRQTSLLLPILTLDDGVYDTTLHFLVRIDTVLGGNGQIGTPRVATGAIFDAGGLPAVKFATTDTTVREDIAPDSVWLRVVLTRKMGYAVTVPVRIDSLAGTAKVPGNFEVPVLSVTFPARTDTVSLLVRIHHDSINTDNLRAVLKLAPNPRDSLTAHADSTARITIRNVDPPPFVSFRDSLVRIRAVDTTVQVPLRLSKISGKTISGTLVVAGGNARPGIDFDLPSGVFTLNPGTSTISVALQVHDDRRYGPARDLWVHFTPMDTSKVLLDPLTSRQAGDARDTVFHLVLTETTARPALSFSPTSDTARDADGSIDLGVVLSGLSDSVAKAGVVFLDSSKPELRKLRLALVTDTATVDSAKLSTTVRVVWTNDGKVYDTARTVHLVLRGSVGASIGRDSIVTLVLLNSNKMPVVVLVTPIDSSHTNKGSEVARWTVDGVEQPTFDTSYKPGWNTVDACYTDPAGNRACDSARVWYDPYPPSVQVFKITGRNPLNPTKDTTWWGDHARTRFGVDTVWYGVRGSS